MEGKKVELEGRVEDAGHARVGPPGFGCHCDDLDSTFMGSQSDIDDFTKRFVNLNREAPV